jgi:hypothetical protein
MIQKWCNYNGSLYILVLEFAVNFWVQSSISEFIPN